MKKRLWFLLTPMPVLLVCSMLVFWFLAPMYLGAGEEPEVKNAILLIWRSAGVLVFLLGSYLTVQAYEKWMK